MGNELEAKKRYGVGSAWHGEAIGWHSALEIFLFRHFIQNSFNHLGIFGEGSELQVAFKVLTGFG